MKKLTALVTASVLGCMLVSCGTGSGADDGKMRADLNAQTCAKEMGVGINLGNTMEAFWADDNDLTAGASTIGENTPQDYEKCWGAVVTTQECIDGMAAEGFDTVRIPVYWGNMMSDDGKYDINEEYMDRVQEIVDYCRRDGLYVVINVHHYDEFLIKHHTKEETLKAAAHVWEQIAKRFKNYSDYLVFEGYNEALGSVQDGTSMTEDEIYEYVNDMNRVFVETVRKSGGNNKDRILIASGYWTNIDNTTKDKFVMPEDSDKMMVSVHYIDNAPYWANSVGSGYWEKYSKGQCEELREAFTERDIPVFVGECTSIYDAEHVVPGALTSESSDCLQKILDMAADYGFVPVLWDVNDNFYSRTDCRIKSDSDREVIREVAQRIESR
ncbi:MAG: glycoside hydrolase family 5 protein [Oscillospiraceae bacterium]|nr:glycoside hydrolase family 5 protein [Oscillospiraceae bacterium]